VDADSAAKRLSSAREPGAPSTREVAEFAAWQQQKPEAPKDESESPNHLPHAQPLKSFASQ